jgi:outer membrane receptor protein involved in Fe transport
LAGAAVVAATGTAYAADQTVETVVVTGSLIQRNAGDMPTPTVVIGSDAIQKTGSPNIGNVLAQLPQVQNAGDLTPTNSNFLTSGFGVWNVDLRALGASRTLVLIDSKRQVTGSPTGSAVDLNTVPTALIDHIEVITGGASAAYGSDAIAGVVNVFLKRDFQGIAATAQYGSSSRGDGSDTYGTITLGGNFANDRGNVTLSVMYDHTGAVMSKDRAITKTDELWSPGWVPIYGPGAFSSYGLNGRFNLSLPNSVGIDKAVGPQFNPDGSPFVKAVSGFDRNPNRYIQVPVSRKVIAETGHYDIADWLSFNLEATYAFTHSSSQIEPYPGTSEDGLSKPVANGGQGILIPLNNPYINPSLLSAIAASQPGGVIPANAAGLFFYRRFADLGDRTGVVDRNFAKIAAGFDGTLPFKDWKWSTYYEWGRTQESQQNGGYYDKIKMQSALNTAVETPTQLAQNVQHVTIGGINYVCADPAAIAAGCVPINLFGAGSITPQAAKYVQSLVTLQDWAEEQVFNFQTNGTVFDLPGGPVKLAAGTEYRRESADFIPDAATQAGTVAGNQQPRTHGAFQVTEVFAEGLVPLVKDLPFAKYAELDGAVRFAHYSTAGDATSWNYRLMWQPIDDLKVRATESSATRAPNIAELYSPPAQTFPGMGTTADPCTTANKNANANRAANCATALAALGAYLPGEPTDPSYSGQIGQAAAQGVGGYQSGNANLKPETASTFTGGIVFTPSWLQNFQATADFYDIRVKHYVAGLSLGSTLHACYDAPSSGYATNIFCQQIVRAHDQTLGPIIKQVNFPTLNLGSIKTSGIDTEFAYAFAMSDLADGLENAGSWSAVLDVNYINSYTVSPGVAGSDPIPSAGNIETPHFRGKFKMTYSNDPLVVTTSLRYVGAGYVDRNGGFPLFVSGNQQPSVIYVDLNVTYDITKTTQAYFGVNNLFDKQAPEIFPGAGYDTTGTGTDANVYDPIGMYLYAGVNFKM